MQTGNAICAKCLTAHPAALDCEIKLELSMPNNPSPDEKLIQPDIVERLRTFAEWNSDKTYGLYGAGKLCAEAAAEIARLRERVADEAAIERVALAILNSDREASGWPPLESRDKVPDSEGYVRNAIAAIAAIQAQ